MQKNSKVIRDSLQASNNSKYLKLYFLTCGHHFNSYYQTE